MNKDEVSTEDIILINTLLNGSFEGPDGDSATLTVKGFVGANIVAARVALLTLARPLSESDIAEVIKFLREAETALNMLEDKEQE